MNGGSHFGTGQSDNGGSLCHEGFLSGQCRDLILIAFDVSVLAEVLATVRGEPENSNV